MTTYNCKKPRKFCQIVDCVVRLAGSQVVTVNSYSNRARACRGAAAKRDDRGKPEIYGTQYKCVFVRSRWQQHQEKPTASLAIL